ncbi:TIR domain-containing protein [Aquincola sp. S2]|uniref:TIR domain-containing protein n=1 Tax=Pseudaquabacterium terrae TaxID=2732868 RepID=A0ABX2ES41_9BURK|nr:TIR domain-containing protein [Aquabacterium terrae]NRF71320.1 TIR domain-containing protein [Aquabacterium terrae]
MWVVFVSFATQNLRVAQRVVEHLEAEGIRCFFAPRDIAVGSTWQDSLSEAIAACSAVVLVLSRHAGASGHVLREVDMAVERRRTILPIQVDENEVPAALDYLLRPFQRLKSSPRVAKRDLDAVVAAVRDVLARTGPGTKPTRPAPAAPGSESPSLYRRLLTFGSQHELDELSERVELALAREPDDVELRMLRRQVQRALESHQPARDASTRAMRAMSPSITYGFLAVIGVGVVFSVWHESPMTPSFPPPPHSASGPVSSAPPPAPVPASTPTPAPAPSSFDPRQEYQRVVAAESQDFGVQAAAARKTLRIGRDALAFTVHAARPGYLYVLADDGQGPLTQLVPNALTGAVKLDAGRAFRFPEDLRRPSGGPAHLTLMAADPPGTMRLLIVVSSVERDLRGLKPAQQGPFSVYPFGSAAAAALAGHTGAQPLLVGRPDCPGSARCDENYGAAILELELVR